MKQITYIFLSLLGVITLIACSSGGSSDDVDSAGGGRGGSESGFLTLNITDAAIDGAAEVWVQFDGVVLKPELSSDAITRPFNPPMKINLLALQGENSVQMLINETLPKGIYDWIKLNVTAADDGIQDSYIKLNDGSTHELKIPSGSESGLKIIGGLEIIANTPTSMTIDFDLRKSIVKTGVGDYNLIPVLKLVDDAETGSIVGTVDLSALTDTGCSDGDPSTGNAIYLYDGFNVTPDDVDNIDPEPVSSALLNLNDTTGEYEYSFGFTSLGKYTAAFTCQADFDNPVVDDVIVFSRAINVNLVDTNTPVVKTFR
jgi:hypothetical protein